MLTGARRPDDRDAGVTAVIVAITLSTVLMAVGALAVDLGNAFARQRALQTSADLAALAGAGRLPDAAGARAAALENLCDDGNRVFGWPDGACPRDPATGALLLDAITWDADLDPDGDRDESNGDIRIDTGTAGQATGIRVVTPAATVTFGLAAVLGMESVAVRRPATARVGTPSRGFARPAPFFLAPGESGTFCVKDPEPGGGDTTTPPEPTPGYEITGIAPAALPTGASSTTVTLTLTGLNNPKPENFEVYFGGVEATVTGLTETSAVVTTPTGLVGPVPVWFVYTQNSNTSYVSTTVTFSYPDAEPVPGCDESTSPRGVVVVPREAGVAHANVLNVQDGIEPTLHNYLTWPGPHPLPALDTPCYTPALPGAVPADVPVTYQEDLNCVKVQTGNVVGQLEPGFFGSRPTEEQVFTGRMRNPCSGQTFTVPGWDAIPMDATDLFDPANGLVRPGLTATELTTLRYNLANGVPATPAQRGWITSKVFDCPRFSSLPILNVSLPPVNGTGYYPIVGFRYAWIDSPDASRGFIWKDGSLKGVRGYVIDPGYLPETITTDETTADETWLDWVDPDVAHQITLVHDESDPPT